MSEFLGAEFEFDLEDIIDSEETIDIKLEEEKKEELSTDKKEGQEEIIKEDPLKEIEMDLDHEGNEINTSLEDEDEEEDDEDEPGEGTNIKPKESSSSSDIADYASALYEEGAFPDIDEKELKEVKSVEDLINLNRKQIKANELKDLSPDQREALEAFRNGISVDDFKQMKVEQLQYDNITDEQINDEEIASKIVTDFLRMTNTDESVIEDLLESYKIDEKLSDKAKVYLPKIKTAIKNKNENFVKQNKAERETAVGNIRTGLDSTKEVFKGININEKDRTELFDQMTRPAKVLEDGTQLDAVMVKRAEDPMSFMIKLHYYTKLGLFDKEPNTEFLQTKARTKALSKLNEKFDKGNSLNRLTGSRKTSDSELYDFDDIPDVKINY
ncbi:MAG: hypothetical protein ACI9LF_001170 [Flavobacteriales bacterium]|jgi:hypothetical protein